MSKEKKISKEEMISMVAMEYYDFLVLKKKGKALRKHCFDATDKFMVSMASLKEHKWKPP